MPQLPTPPDPDDPDDPDDTDDTIKHTGSASLRSSSLFDLVFGERAAPPHISLLHSSSTITNGSLGAFQDKSANRLEGLL